MKKILLWLICISILRGVTYIVITPPWQAPDETTHFQFIELLTQRPLSEIRKIPLHSGDGKYFELERKILESMKKFKAWQYVGLPTPDPMPDCFFNAPFFVGSAPKIYRPPLYYLIGAGILKVFHPKELETRLYVARVYSLFLSIGTVIFSCLIGYAVFKDENYALLTAAFVSFLPQFMVIGTSVNSDNLVNLLASVFLLYAIFLLHDNKSDFYMIPILFFLPVLFLSGKTGIMITPIAILLFIFQMIKSKKPLVILTVGLLILGSSAILIQYIWPGMIMRACQILKTSFDKVHSGLIRDLSFYHYFSVLLFKSFWFVGGWMAIYWNRWIYAVVGILSIFSILGLFKYLFDQIANKQEDPSLSNPILFLMALMVILTLGTCLLYYGFFRGILAQGRYLFPVLPAYAILFIAGLRKLSPPLLIPHLPMGSVIFLACLDIYTLFGCLLPYYHFR